jgi:hypothetical protein
LRRTSSSFNLAKPNLSNGASAAGGTNVWRQLIAEQRKGKAVAFTYKTSQNYFIADTWRPDVGKASSQLWGPCARI